jgi:hypothetical protein
VLKKRTVRGLGWWMNQLKEKTNVTRDS